MLFVSPPPPHASSSLPISSNSLSSSSYANRVSTGLESMEGSSKKSAEDVNKNGPRKVLLHLHAPAGMACRYAEAMW